MSGKEEYANTIEGYVFDERGRPVSGAIVLFDGVESRTLFNGSFKFEEFSFGSHRIEVYLEGYKGQERMFEATLEKAEVIEFHLEPEEGDAKICGQILDESTKQPVTRGGSVYMLRSKDNRNVAFDPLTGYYEFAKLPPGTYTIWTSIIDHDDEKKTITIDKGEEVRVDLHVKKKEEEEVPWG